MLPGFWGWDHRHSQSQSQSSISGFRGEFIRKGATGCTCGSSMALTKDAPREEHILADAAVRRRVCGNRACATARPFGQICAAVAVCGRAGEQSRGARWAQDAPRYLPQSVKDKVRRRACAGIVARARRRGHLAKSARPWPCAAARGGVISRRTLGARRTWVYLTWRHATRARRKK